MRSKIVYIAAVVLMGYASFFFYPRWQQKGGEATLSWDVSGYYWYLPSIFIYHDLKHQSFKDSVFKKYQPASDFQQGFQTDNGNYVMKYSSGMACMFLPFFTVAHFIAPHLGYPADGFSPPYQFAIQFGGFLIAIIGLWYLRRLLLRFYSDNVVACVIALLVIGTNYLNFSVIDAGMSHNWLFTIYVFLMLSTDNFYKTYKTKYAVAIGLLVGLATLTRPTDIISCLIPLLWGVDGISIRSIRDRLTLWAKLVKPLALAVACACAVICIQPLYWKYVSGHWIVYSYGNQGFSWKHPHALLYMLNYRSGWLTYTPMMALALIGILPFGLKGRNRLAIIAFIAIDYYIVSAWDIWWYGGRAMVQSYAVMMFPMAAMVQSVFDRKWLASLFIPVALVFTYFNIWVIYHYHKGGMYDTDCMTKNYFWRVAGHWQAPPENTIVLRDGGELYEGTPRDLNCFYGNDLEQDTTLPEQTDAIQGKRSWLLDKNKGQTPICSLVLPAKMAQWLRVSATFRCNNKEWDVWSMAQFVVRAYKKDQLVKENMVRVYRLLNDHDTKDISVDMELPRAGVDSVTYFIWNANSEKQLWIDNIKACTFSGQ